MKHLSHVGARCRVQRHDVFVPHVFKEGDETPSPTETYLYVRQSHGCGVGRCADTEGVRLMGICPGTTAPKIEERCRLKHQIVNDFDHASIQCIHNGAWECSDVTY